jgi:hypothetical protein
VGFQVVVYFRIGAQFVTWKAILLRKPRVHIWRHWNVIASGICVMRFKINAWCALFDLALVSTDTVSMNQVGDSPQGQHSAKEPSMANVLTTGAWLSAPTKKPSFFVRLLRVQIAARQRSADRVVEQYLATHGLDKLTDDAERQIERLLFRGGQ